MSSTFPWPEGKRCAVSLSYDDARPSQLEIGIPILDSFDLRATFYVCLPEIRAARDAWRAAIARGHEVGNHTVNHPCSGNYFWCKTHLENYTLEKMERELIDAQQAIRETLGVTPSTFAYPCGNKFVGTGERTHSYVPQVSRHFLAGRGFRDETPANPLLCDLAQLPGVDSDRHPFDVLKTWIDRTIERGHWICFVSHDVHPTLPQSIKPDTLKQICEYLKAKDEVWTDTIETIARHVTQGRTAT